MAFSKTETQVQWGAANSVSVAAGGTQTSDTVTLDVTCYAATVHLKADNSTTPAADDQIYFWVQQTGGDPDGTGTDEFDSSRGSLLLAIMDTNAQDPFLTSIPLPVDNKSLRLFAEGTTAGTTNAITVSATITEHRA